MERADWTGGEPTCRRATAPERLEGAEAVGLRAADGGAQEAAEVAVEEAAEARRASSLRSRRWKAALERLPGMVGGPAAREPRGA